MGCENVGDCGCISLSIFDSSNNDSDESRLMLPVMLITSFSSFSHNPSIISSGTESNMLCDGDAAPEFILLIGGVIDVVGMVGMVGVVS